MSKRVLALSSTSDASDRWVVIGSAELSSPSWIVTALPGAAECGSGSRSFNSLVPTGSGSELLLCSCNGIDDTLCSVILQAVEHGNQVSYLSRGQQPEGLDNALKIKVNVVLNRCTNYTISSELMGGVVMMWMWVGIN